MSTEFSDPAELVGREPDERLLSEDLDKLPAAVGRPEIPPPARARRRIVGAGAALTGVSLVIGVLLVLAGVVDAIASGLEGSALLALAVGVILIATHWGWVHVAEITGSAPEGRANAEVLTHNREWLAEIEPYARFEVSTAVEDDGSISIESVRFRPVTRGERGFTFVRTV